MLISLLPIFNIVVNGIPDEPRIEDKIKNSYSMDKLEEYFNNYLYSFGISGNSEQVIVGSDGWLFVGDKYANNITEFRKGSDSKKEISKKIIDAQTDWAKYLSTKGVIDFKIVVGPNKSTIYAEKVPDWAKSQGKSISENLYKSNIYVNSIEELVISKRNEDVYYSTDTHWNNYGAGVAFGQLIKGLNTVDGFIYPNENWSKIVRISQRTGGDLANFLKIEKLMSDKFLVTEINTKNHEHYIYNYNSRDLLYAGKNVLYGNIYNPIIIHTPSALNQSKILWLSDSFGGAMAAYMEATFSHVLKKHWKGVVGTPLLEELVEDWKPDYVFYTVVERDSLSPVFLVEPPK